MQLTPVQIGQLAKFVLDSIQENQKPAGSDSTPNPYDADSEIKMDPWEKALKEKVDSVESTLPKYDELQRDHWDVLEFFVEYYS